MNRWHHANVARSRLRLARRATYVAALMAGEDRAAVRSRLAIPERTARRYEAQGAR